MNFLNSLFGGIGNMLGSVGKFGSSLMSGLGNLGTQTFNQGKSVLDLINPATQLPKYTQGIPNYLKAGSLASSAGRAAGPLALGGASAVGSGAAIPAGLGNLFNPSASAGSSVGKNFLSMLFPSSGSKTSLLGPAMGGQPASTWSGSPGGMLPSYMQPKFTPTAPPAGYKLPFKTSTMGGGTSTLQGAGNDFWNQMMGSAFKGVNLPQTLLGYGISELGGLIHPQPKMPDVSQLPSYQALQNLNVRSYEEIPPELLTSLEHDMDKIDTAEDRQFQALWKNRRPNADIERDSGFRNAWNEHKDAQAQRRTDYIAKAKFDFFARNLGLSQVEMERLTKIAQVDELSIMGQLGLDIDGARRFQSVFSDIGGALMSKGMGLERNQSMAGA